MSTEGLIFASPEPPDGISTDLRTSCHRSPEVTATSMVSGLSDIFGHEFQALPLHYSHAEETFVGATSQANLQKTLVVHVDSGAVDSKRQIRAGSSVAEEPILMTRLSAEGRGEHAPSRSESRCCMLSLAKTGTLQSNSGLSRN